jgi:hypothetical protein
MANLEKFQPRHEQGEERRTPYVPGPRQLENDAHTTNTITLNVLVICVVEFELTTH